MWSPESESMCTAPESWNAALVSGLSPSRWPVTRALTSGAVWSKRNPQRSMTAVRASRALSAGPPCGAGGAMATSAVNPHSMPAQKNMAWHMRSLSPFPQYRMANAAAARQLSAAAR